MAKKVEQNRVTVEFLRSIGVCGEDSCKTDEDGSISKVNEQKVRAAFDRIARLSSPNNKIDVGDIARLNDPQVAVRLLVEDPAFKLIEETMLKSARNEKVPPVPNFTDLARLRFFAQALLKATVKDDNLPPPDGNTFSSSYVQAVIDFKRDCGIQSEPPGEIINFNTLTALIARTEITKEELLKQLKALKTKIGKTPLSIDLLNKDVVALAIRWNGFRVDIWENATVENMLYLAFGGKASSSINSSEGLVDFLIDRIERQRY